MRLSAVLAALLPFAAASTPATADSLLIPAEKIYTAPDAAPLANGSVLVTDGRIAAVADERSRMAIPKGTQTSDCRGVVMAGFQNSHVHFMGPGFADAAQRPAADVEGAVEAMLTRYGFTTVFDTGSDRQNTVALRERIEKGEIRGPRILTVGWPIYPVDGIPIYLAHLPKAMLEQLRQPRSPEEARADVRENLDGGADGAKIFMVTTPTRTENKVLSPDITRAVVAEAHSRGKLVLAHPTSLDGIRAALDAGVDVVVHTTLGERQPWDQALVKNMVAKKMSLIPTLKLWSYELAKQSVPPHIVENLVDATLAELRIFHSAGGQVLFGTDVGYMGEFDPTDEYVLLQKAGLSPMDILASLTTAPADRWQESESRGRVQAGMAADLVVLGGDPAVDVKNFSNVRCVFRAGKLVYASKPSP